MASIIDEEVAAEAKKKEEEEKLANEKKEREAYAEKVKRVFLLCFLTLLGVALFLNLVAEKIEMLGESFGIGTIMFYLLLLYMAASLRIVGPTELGCRLLFGKPIDNVSSGLTFVPLGISGLVLETKLVIQDEFPAEPEKIYRGGPGDEHGRTVPKDLQEIGMKPPIRVTFSDRNKESGLEEIPENDPYDCRLTAEVIPVVRWRIDDYVLFLQTIHSIDGAKGARKQLEDSCVKTFTELLTKVTPAVALRRIRRYSNELHDELEILTNSWGIKIENAQIKAIPFSRSINDAVQNVVVQERQKMASILEGQGIGGKKRAELDGYTDGLKKRMDLLDVKGEIVLGAETARDIAGTGDKSSQRTIIAGSGGFADLIGTAAAIAESLKTKQEGAK